MRINPPQNRGLTAIDGAMALIVILLMVQIWLLSATLMAERACGRAVHISLRARIPGSRSLTGRCRRRTEDSIARQYSALV